MAAVAAAEPAAVDGADGLGVRRVGAVLREVRREMPRFNGRNAILIAVRVREVAGRQCE